MPARYSFECPLCGQEDPDVILNYEDRDTTLVVCGKCDVPMDRLFPCSAATGIEVFTPYFDEMMGVNIYTKDQHKAEMRKRNLIEAGDKVGGARDYDEYLPDGSRVDRQPIKAGMDGGVIDLNAEREDFEVEVTDKEGNTLEKTMFSKLEEETPSGDEQKAKEAFENIKLKNAKKL
jgi:transcription elongation factor Elf1